MRARTFISFHPVEKPGSEGEPVKLISLMDVDWFTEDGGNFKALLGLGETNEMGFTNLKDLANGFEKMAEAARRLHEQYEAMKFPGLSAEMPSEEAAKKYN